jgi:hypothetical protein
MMLVVCRAYGRYRKQKEALFGPEFSLFRLDAPDNVGPASSSDSRAEAAESCLAHAGLATLPEQLRQISLCLLR